MPKINIHVLMSGAEYFDDSFAINSYMDDHVAVDKSKAITEHDAIMNGFSSAGIKITKVDAPSTSQDGVYTANWALCVGNKAIMANLPNKRQSEEPYAEKILKNLGKQIIKLPKAFHFSGQGDCLPCGRYLFTGTGYRTSPEVHPLLARETGLQVISLTTIPQLDKDGLPVINKITGWPDSFFYDIDLAIAVISPNIIAWCPEAFLPDSQAKIRALDDLIKIEVSLDEAMHASACNLVSTGDTVIMGSRAPKLKNNLLAHGLKVIDLDIAELLKGGGFIRCTSLTLDN